LNLTSGRFHEISNWLISLVFELEGSSVPTTITQMCYYIVTVTERPLYLKQRILCYSCINTFCTSILVLTITDTWMNFNNLHSMLLIYLLFIREFPCEDIYFFLTFCWPCIVTYPYNKNQEDALFTFNLFQ